MRDPKLSLWKSRRERGGRGALCLFSTSRRHVPPAQQLSALHRRRGARTPNTARELITNRLRGAEASRRAPNPGPSAEDRVSLQNPSSSGPARGGLAPEGPRTRRPPAPPRPASAPPARVPAPRDCGRRAGAGDAAPSAGERAPAGSRAGSAAAAGAAGLRGEDEGRGARTRGEEQGGARPGRSRGKRQGRQESGRV